MNRETSLGDEAPRSSASKYTPLTGQTVTADYINHCHRKGIQYHGGEDDLREGGHSPATLQPQSVNVTGECVVYMENGIALQESPRLPEKCALLDKGRHLRRLDAWPSQLGCHCRCVVGARSGRLLTECSRV
jgi:hypothetical protein